MGTPDVCPHPNIVSSILLILCSETCLVVAVQEYKGGSFPVPLKELPTSLPCSPIQPVHPDLGFPLGTGAHSPPRLCPCCPRARSVLPAAHCLCRPIFHGLLISMKPSLISPPSKPGSLPPFSQLQSLKEKCLYPQFCILLNY